MPVVEASLVTEGIVDFGDEGILALGYNLREGVSYGVEVGS
jgi:hypothetical protein